MTMKSILPILFLLPLYLSSQDLSEGLLTNDLSVRSMQDIAKPNYLETIIDPSFGTTIRRISDAGDGGVIVPMYSTIQAWNADESLMILYNQSNGQHELLDGKTYQYIRNLTDVNPSDLEEIFWDYDNPTFFYYVDRQSSDFIKYNVLTQEKFILINLVELTGCTGRISMGNNIQMMSWDSDVFSFRCNNETAFAYRLSSEELISFQIEEVDNVAPAVAPSGNKFYHRSTVYNDLGAPDVNLNISSPEHSCIGTLSNGNDAYYAIAFAQGPQGGCIGDIIAHDLTTGTCFPVISQSQGYEYPQSGTHISALAHKNTEGGWLAASMVGYDKDGQSLLDQELVIAKANGENIVVCRIGHHRSDEDEYDYWGEPHAVISPTGTRVLFGSDWSGAEDGLSVDSYVVELPSYSNSSTVNEITPIPSKYKINPNPVADYANITFNNPNNEKALIRIYNAMGSLLVHDEFYSDTYLLNAVSITTGINFFEISCNQKPSIIGKFIKK